MSVKKLSFTLLILFITLLIMSYPAYAGNIRVGVADFVDRTGKSNTNKVTEVFTNILASSSEKFEVIGHESLQGFDETTSENATIAGKTANCQYIVLGTIAKADIESHYTTAKKSSLFYSYSVPKTQHEKEIVNLEARVINVGTGKIILSVSGQGIASRSYDIKEHSKKYSSAPYDKKKQKEIADEYEKLRMKALSSASSMLAEKISAFLTGEYPQVNSIKAGTKGNRKKNKKGKKNDDSAEQSIVVINRGTSSGVNEGTLYRIYAEGAEVLDLSGNSLGREKFNVAVAEVREAKIDYCTATIIGGNPTNILVGDKAEQITQEEASILIEGQNDFSRSRL